MTITIHELFALLIIFQLKHFIADYLLQHNYMLLKVRPNWDFVVPLALHCGVHGGLTLLICLYFNKNLWWLAVADFAIHFITDRLRSGPRYLGRFMNFKHYSYWWILGLDQMVHHLTHIWIIWMIATS